MSDERSHGFTRGLYGWITHTDLCSTGEPADQGHGRRHITVCASGCQPG
jgi:hypothetical protein